MREEMKERMTLGWLWTGTGATKAGRNTLLGSLAWEEDPMADWNNLELGCLQETNSRPTKVIFKPGDMSRVVIRNAFHEVVIIVVVQARDFKPPGSSPGFDVGANS